MYARGMSTREIVGHLRDLYGVEVSPDLSAVTDAVLEEVAAWQARPMEEVYPLIFFDALRAKIRDEGLVRNKAVQIALGVRADDTKEIFGLWLEQNEGAKFDCMFVVFMITYRASAMLRQELNSLSSHTQLMIRPIHRDRYASVSPLHLVIDKPQVSELAPPSRLAHTTPIDHTIVYVIVTKLPIRQLTLLNVLNQQW
jgi:hypothetical protein